MKPCKIRVEQPLSDPQKQYTSEEVLYDLITIDDELIAKLSPQAEARYAQLFLP